MAWDTCRRCNRTYTATVPASKHGIGRCQPCIGVFYVHAGFGCDTGCCGHRFVAVAASGDEGELAFEFTHDADEIAYKASELAASLNVPVLQDRCEMLVNC
jgi:hypothetical protein